MKCRALAAPVAVKVSDAGDVRGAGSATATGNVTECLPSEMSMSHDDTYASGVTLNVAFGPFAFAGVTVAAVPQPFRAVNVPLNPLSVAVNDAVDDEPVEEKTALAGFSTIFTAAAAVADATIGTL